MNFKQIDIYPPRSMGTGQAGQAFALSLTGEGPRAAKILEKTFREEAPCLANLSFISGLTGVLYASSFCPKTRDLSKYVRAHRRRLKISIPSYLSEYGRTEFFTGATGFGLYARRTDDEFIIKCVLDYLRLSLEDTKIGTFWLFPRQGLENASVMEINLGMAHGACGTIAFLSRMVLSNCKFAREAKALLKEVLPAVEYLRRGIADDRIPPVFKGKYISKNGSWCYGDPGSGFAFALMGKALGHSNLYSWGLGRALAGVAIPKGRTRNTGGLCHGPAAQALVSIFLNREFSIDTQAATRFWLAKENQLGMGASPKDFSIGIIGLGGYRLLKALQAEKVDGKWAECFLLA